MTLMVSLDPVQARYIDKKIAALEARAANKGVGNPELNTTDPVDTAPEPINTAPGTGPWY